MTSLRRIIHPAVRILDETKGLAEYVASDETLDSYKEVIRADGWRFDDFKKNAPFVDSHDYSSIDRLLGQVVDFRVEGKRLVETVQWAMNVAESRLAQIGWAMTKGGFLKAVSVGFWPVRMVNKWDADKTGWHTTLRDLELDEASGVRTIYLEQQQIELSACIIGANPNALARSYKAGVIDDAALEFLASEHSKRATAPPAFDPALAGAAQERARALFAHEIVCKSKLL